MEFINAVVWFITIASAIMFGGRVWGLWDMTPYEMQRHGRAQAGSVIKWFCVLVLSILWHIYGG